MSIRERAQQLVPAAAAAAAAASRPPPLLPAATVVSDCWHLCFVVVKRRSSYPTTVSELGSTAGGAPWQAAQRSAQQLEHAPSAPQAVARRPARGRNLGELVSGLQTKQEQGRQRERQPEVGIARARAEHKLQQRQQLLSALPVQPNGLPRAHGAQERRQQGDHSPHGSMGHTGVAAAAAAPAVNGQDSWSPSAPTPSSSGASAGALTAAAAGGASSGQQLGGPGPYGEPPAFLGPHGGGPLPALSFSSFDVEGAVGVEGSVGVGEEEESEEEKSIREVYQNVLPPDVCVVDTLEAAQAVVAQLMSPEMAQLTFACDTEVMDIDVRWAGQLWGAWVGWVGVGVGVGGL